MARTMGVPVAGPRDAGLVAGLADREQHSFAPSAGPSAEHLRNRVSFPFLRESHSRGWATCRLPTRLDHVPPGRCPPVSAMVRAAQDWARRRRLVNHSDLALVCVDAEYPKELESYVVDLAGDPLSRDTSIRHGAAS
jgi:hypothetical protein